MHEKYLPNRNKNTVRSGKLPAISRACLPKMKKLFIFIALAVSSCALAADSPPKIQSEIIIKSNRSWDGTLLPVYPGGQPETSVLKITIPPHSELDWHSHPVINAAYVLSGSITVIKKDDGKRLHLEAGQVAVELVNAVHRGETGNEPVVLLVFYAGKEGIPLSIPFQASGNRNQNE